MKITDYGVVLDVRGHICTTRDVLHTKLSERISSYTKQFGDEFSDAKIGTLGSIKYNGSTIGNLFMIPVGEHVYASPTKKSHKQIYAFSNSNRKIKLYNISEEFVQPAFPSSDGPNTNMSEKQLNENGWYKLYVK